MFEVNRCPHSLGLFVPLEALQWAEEAEQQLSRLAPSAWELPGDVRTFGAGLPEAPCRDPYARCEV